MNTLQILSGRSMSIFNNTKVYFTKDSFRNYFNIQNYTL